MRPYGRQWCGGCSKPSRDRASAEICPHAGLSSQYRGVTYRRSGLWAAYRKKSGRSVYLGRYHSEEDAAHVWDLSSICLGLSEAKRNFPTSEYEAGGRWAEEAREAARTDIDELATIWSQRALQRTLDGVHSRPLRLCRLMLVCHCSASSLACERALWAGMRLCTCVCMLFLHASPCCAYCDLTRTARGFAACARDEEGVPWQPRHVNRTSWHDHAGETWQVQFYLRQRCWHFGTYNDRAQAARVADRAALVLLGEHTPLNLPGLITAKERRALSEVEDVAAFAEECRTTAPCAQPPKSCEYIGVHLRSDHRKFEAALRVCGTALYLGSFAASEDAACAYDKAAVLADMYAPKKRGGAREFNFPSKCQV
jgi:AP2 domain